LPFFAKISGGHVTPATPHLGTACDWLTSTRHGQ